MRSIVFDADDSRQRPPWQPRKGEGFVGAANGKSPREALLQFQKEPGGPSLRYMNPTRIYRYECSAIELKGAVDD